MSETSTTSPALSLDERTLKQAHACVHCGLCLPACPTYTQDGDENDSPRGRIHIMNALHEGRIEPTTAVVRHLDLCLDCRACETACPSGVVYHEIIEETRAKLKSPIPPSFSDRIVNYLCLHVMPYPRKLRWALLPARLLQKVRLYGLVSKLGGNKLAKMQQMLPDTGPLWPKELAAHHPANGAPRMKVGFLAGCVGSVMYGHVNRMAVELLAHLGCEVVVPPSQNCCGAIHHHGGHPDVAADFAKRNIEAFEGCDRIVNAIAGCGAMLKDYGHLLRDDAAWADRAADFVKRTRDISQLLAELDPPAPTHRVSMTAVYHDACHLAHAQKITAEPRRLLAKVEGLRLIPLAESDMCCGAAGTYNLQQPAMATDLGSRKIRHIRTTGAGICITGNVGCAMQIQSQARSEGLALTVLHPVEVLHRAYLGS
ncbi:MAG: 4Fe-4S dicluster domain-containing protein [Planctomycetes bacterium]|nr:4Fe-4S dicluster domain-containing protein [Planctomycetota bacterium]